MAVPSGLTTTTTTRYSRLPPECWHPGAKTCEQLILESYDWRDLAYLNLTFRNIGPGGIGIIEVHLDGVGQDWSGDCPWTPWTTDSEGNPIENRSALLQPSQSCSISITVTCGLCSSLAVTSGQVYPLRVQTYYGGVFSYSVIAGRAQ